MSGLSEAEVEMMRREARHEFGRDYRIVDLCASLDAARARVASAAADREAVERVRALRDRWLDIPCAIGSDDPVCTCCMTDALRAALSVPTEAEGAS